jgi:hypothetical protein
MLTENKEKYKYCRVLPRAETFIIKKAKNIKIKNSQCFFGY